MDTAYKYAVLIIRSSKEKGFAMLAGYRRRDFFTDIFLERSGHDVGVMRKAFIDVAKKHTGDIELPFEEILERIDVRRAEREAQLSAQAHI